MTEPDALTGKAREFAQDWGNVSLPHRRSIGVFFENAYQFACNYLDDLDDMDDPEAGYDVLARFVGEALKERLRIVDREEAEMLAAMAKGAMADEDQRRD